MDTVMAILNPITGYLGRDLILGFIGGVVYVFMELVERSRTPAGDRTPVTYSVLTGIGYPLGGLLVVYCNLPDEGNLTKWAALQLGLSSPLILRQALSSVTQPSSPSTQEFD